jgi:hypothetical protein
MRQTGSLLGLDELKTLKIQLAASKNNSSLYGILALFSRTSS